VSDSSTVSGLTASAPALPVAPPGARPRNIVACCDGTGNTWSASGDTNVVKLFRDLLKDEQTVFYDPGVGTASNFPGVDLRQDLNNTVNRIAGLAIGNGIYENIADAYVFLMRNTRPEDKIFVFGFSRGAFTARAVAGMVHLFGLIRGESENMVPMLVRIYFSRTDAAFGYADPATGKIISKSMREGLADDIRANFTDPGFGYKHIHFVGVWETVESVGGLFGFRARISSSPTIRGKRIDHVRQALSLDETRWTFLPRLYEENNFGSSASPQSLTQEWFPGVHSDVGGGYGSSAARHAAGESGGGLAHAPMRWIVGEAEKLGLALKPRWQDAFPDEPYALLHDEVFTHPAWALAGLRRREWPPAHVGQPALLDKTVVEREQHGGAPYRPLALLIPTRDSPQEAPSKGIVEGVAWPPNTTVWKPLLTRRIFWLLLVLTALMWGWLTYLGADALHWIANAPSFPVPAWGEWLRENLSCMIIENPKRLLLADFLFIPVYGLFLALLSSHAWRVLVRYSKSVRADTFLLCLSLMPVALIGADLVENVTQWQMLSCTPNQPYWCGLLDWVGCIATLCKNLLIVGTSAYLLSGAVFSLGLLRRRR
jgi:uncharacterized protein (DUF2235 family)